MKAISPDSRLRCSILTILIVRLIELANEVDSFGERAQLAPTGVKQMWTSWKDCQYGNGESNLSS